MNLQVAFARLAEILDGFEEGFMLSIAQQGAQFAAEIGRTEQEILEPQ